MSALPKPYISPEEYLKHERQAETRSEYFDGELFAMAGGTKEHSVIANNVGAELRSLLKKTPCIVYNSELRVQVAASGLFTYPDVTVACDEARFLDERGDTLLTPTLIVEVLSPTTEAYDRGAKFAGYRQIPTLRDYLLVSTAQPLLELFSRQQDGRFLLTEARGMESELYLPSLNITLTLSEVYDKVFGS